jgi:hypothetical protein
MHLTVYDSLRNGDIIWVYAQLWRVTHVRTESDLIRFSGIAVSGGKIQAFGGYRYTTVRRVDPERAASVIS